MQIKQAVDDREDDMIISQRGGSVVVAARHIPQLGQSIYSEGTIAGLKAVVPDEAMRKSEQF